MQHDEMLEIIIAELTERGHKQQRREDPEHQLSGGFRGVNGSPVSRQHLEGHAAFLQVVDGIDEMAQISPQTVQLPNQEDISLPKGFEHGH